MSIKSIISQIAGGYSPGGTTDLPGITNPLFIFMGESNSNGEALNSSATSEELAPTSVVQILNIYTYLFEDLDIGVNNDGDYLTTHGAELELANMTKANDFAVSQIHLVKTGYGGTRMSQWLGGSGLYVELAARVNAALSIDPTFTPIIFFSLGINDALYGTPTDNATWKSQVLEFFSNVRTDFGANIPIVMTHLPTAYNRYDSTMDEICTEIPYCYTIETADLNLVDAYHYDYLGQKAIAQRSVAKIKEHYTI